MAMLIHRSVPRFHLKDGKCWVAIPLPSSRFCLIIERTALSLCDFIWSLWAPGGVGSNPFVTTHPFLILDSSVVRNLPQAQIIQKVRPEWVKCKWWIFSSRLISTMSPEFHLEIYMLMLGHSISTSCLCTYFIGWIYDLTWGSQKFLKKSKCRSILLMEEIIQYQMIGSLSHYLQGFLHPRWLFGMCLPSVVSY